MSSLVPLRRTPHRWHPLVLDPLCGIKYGSTFLVTSHTFWTFSPTKFRVLRPHLFCSILQVKSMKLDERAWLRDRLREQIVQATKSLADLRAFLSTRPHDKDAQEHFLPQIEEHERTIENCQKALNCRRLPKKLWLCLPLEWVDRKGRIVAPPSPIPSYDTITSLTLNVYGIETDSPDWQHSLPSFRSLKHLTLVTAKAQALPIAKHCLEVCPKLSFLTLLWAFVLDWRCLGPEDGYFMELEALLRCSMGKLKQLELDWIIYKRITQMCNGVMDGREPGKARGWGGKRKKSRNEACNPDGSL